MALPVFALLVLAEVLYTRSQGRSAYALKDFGGSMSQLGINSLVRLAIGGALISLHFFLYQFRVFEVPNAVWGWVLTFIDFVYRYHRAQHRVRRRVPTWCYSSEHMNLGTALRQSPTGPFTRALFYWPLPLLGFHPLMVAGAGAVATIYAFFTHTEVEKAVLLEWWLVTPHHRAHHGSNPEYVDRNLATCLLCGIGCLAPSSPRCAGALRATDQYQHLQPVADCFDEWVRLFKASFQARSIRQLAVLVPTAPQSAGAAEPN